MQFPQLGVPKSFTISTVLSCPIFSQQKCFVCVSWRSPKIPWDSTALDHSSCEYWTTQTWGSSPGGHSFWHSNQESGIHHISWYQRYILNFNSHNSRGTVGISKHYSTWAWTLDRLSSFCSVVSCCVFACVFFMLSNHLFEPNLRSKILGS